MKTLIKHLLRSLGFEFRRIPKKSSGPAAGSADRPIGDVKMFLEDLKARGFEPRGIVDVGANKGDWTRLSLSVFPRARVLMIEPQPEMRSHLEQLCRDNPNLEFVQAGAGRDPGQLVQTIWKDLAGSSFLPKPSEEKLRDGTQRITPVVTIDSLVNGRSGFHPDLVKLDIQGFEIEALRGSTTLFGRTHVFILETSLYRFMPNMPVTAECIEFMSARNYDLYDVVEYRRRPLDGALGQIDLAFVLRDGAFRRSRLWEANPRS